MRGQSLNSESATLVHKAGIYAASVGVRAAERNKNAKKPPMNKDDACSGSKIDPRIRDGVTVLTAHELTPLTTYKTPWRM